MVLVLFAKWDWTSPELPVDSWWLFGGVLVLLVISIWVVALLTSSSTDDIDPAEIDRQMLSAVSELQSQGELTPEEYRSIKSRLVERLSNQTTSAVSDDSSCEEQQAKQNEGEQYQTTDTSTEKQKLKPSAVEDSTQTSNLDSEKDQNA